MAAQDRTRGRAATDAGDDASRTTRATSSRVTRETEPEPTPAPKPTPETPTPPRRLPRTGVGVSVPIVRAAFVAGEASQSVGYIQHVLTDHGFDPGNRTGVATRETRDAVARFQQSIGEEPTGLPTDYTVDHLGFDIYG